AASSLEAEVGARVSLRATLSRTTDARALSGKSLEFLVDGLAVGSATTGADGAAELPFATVGLSAGTHGIQARFSEDDSYLASEGAGNLNLLPFAVTQIQIDGLATIRVGEIAPLRARLLSGDQPLPGRLLTFTVLGSTPASAVTDEHGVAWVQYKAEEGPSGERPVEVTFAGEDGYRPARDSAMLSVLKAPTWLDLGSSRGLGGGYLLNLDKVLCVGDSLTQGSISNNYRSHLAATLAERGYTFTSVGPEPNPNTDGANNLLRHGGMTRYKILDIAYGTADRPDLAIGSMMTVYRPNLVLLMLGTNDRLSTITVAILKDRYNQLLDNLFAVDPDVQVVMACPPNGAPDPTTNRAEFVVMCETAVREVVAERKAAGRSVSFVDMVGVLDPATDFLPGDLLHPNALGNAKLAANFYQAIRVRALRLPVVPDGEEARLRAVLRRTTDDRPLSGKRVEFILDGSSVGEAWTSNGVAELLVPEGVLSAGEHTVEVRFAEDDSYLASQRSGKIDQAGPIAARLEAEAPAPVRIGETARLSAKLTREGAPLAGRTVTFKIAAETVGTATTDEQGVATLGHKIEEGPAGERAVEASFAGDDSYAPANDAATLEVLRAPTQVSVTSLEARAGQPISLRASLARAADGRSLADKSLEFLVDGAAVGTATTGADGSAEVPFPTAGLSAGPHAVLVRFAEDDSCLGSEGSGTLTLSVVVTQLDMASPTPVRIGESARLSATLTSQEGPLAGRTVSFKIGGAEVGAATTDEHGAATLDHKVEEGPAGQLSVAASFDGEDGYAPVSDSDSLEVLRAPTEIAVSSLEAKVGAPVSLRAALSRTTDGKPLPGKSLEFLVDGNAVGSATTGADGAAELPFDTSGLSAGPHTVLVRFAEDDSYLASEGAGTLTVAAADTRLVLAAPTPVRIGETAHLNATLTTAQGPLSGRNVSFKVAGAVAGTATTNEQGIAALDFKIEEGPAGGRPVEASFAGEDAYAPASDSATLEVLKFPTGIAVSSLEAKVKAPVSLRAALSRTTDGDRLSGKSLVFLVDGIEVGTATTGADGSAEIPFDTSGLSSGSHEVLVRFAEDDSYLASEGSGVLTLTAKEQPKIWVGSRTAYIGEKVYYRATLTKPGTNVYVLGKTINFYLGDRLVGSGITSGAQGYAEVVETLPEGTLAGNQTIRAVFDEDAEYLGVSGTAAMVVKKTPTSVWVGDRAAVPGQIVKFRSTVRNNISKALLVGKTLGSSISTWAVWSAVTAGSLGYAEADVLVPEGTPAGNYAITTNFAGDLSYEPSTGTGTLTVSRATVSLWIGNRSGRAGQSVQYRATIRNATSKTYLFGKVLRVKLGATVVGTATSDAEGYITINATIPSGLSAGNHTLTVEFDGQRVV
ncbi:hypothetical protein EON82_16725, partial [bacterium]